MIGGSSGVGRAVGLAAARSGDQVAFAGRRAELVTEAARAAGTGCVGLSCDVRDPGGCEEVVSAAARSLGGLDALLYTPAQVHLTWLADASAEDWRAVFEINVVGAALVTRAALGHLRQAKGRVVFISSDWTRFPRAALTLYGSTKAALDALCQGFRIEVPDVRFTTVVLGPTFPTEIARDWDIDKAQPILKLWEEAGIRYRGLMDTDDAAAQILSVLTSAVRVEEIVLEPPDGGPQ